jgi:outer membrane protein assembly factor BamE (lipoprotein component of BamABCDE complex)
MRRLLPVALLMLVVAGCGPSANDQATRLAQDRTGWRKLAKGMTPDKVRAVLGEPLRVEDQAEVTCWYYQEGQPLERNATDPGKWMIPRGALLFSTKPGGGPKLTEWREP